MPGKFDLSLIIRAVDKATAPVRAIAGQIARLTGPLAAVSAAFRPVANAFVGLGKELGLEKVWGALKDNHKALGELGTQAWEVGKTFLAVGGIAVGALGGLVVSAMHAGTEAAITSRRLGVGVDVLQRWKYAAGQAGVTGEEFTGAMEHFARNLGEANAGTGPMLGFFRNVSPAMAQQIQRTHGVGAGLQLVMQAFQRVKDPAKRAALEVALFGRAGGGMAMFASLSAEKLAALGAQFDQLAGPQAEFAEMAEEATKGWDRFETSLGGVRNAIFVGLQPALLAISDTVSKFIGEHREELTAWAKETGAAIKAWVDGGGLQRLAKSISDLAEGVSEFVGFIGGWKVAAIAVAAVMAGPLLSAIATAIPAIISLGVALLTTPVGWILGGIALIAFAIYEIRKHWEPITEWFSSVWNDPLNGLKSAWEGIGTFFADTWKGIADQFIGGWKVIKPIVDAIGTVLAPVGGVISRFASGSASGPSSGAAGPALGVAPPLLRAPEAKVTVDFANVPRGVRVAADPDSSADVDLNAGYAMFTP